MSNIIKTVAAFDKEDVANVFAGPIGFSEVEAERQADLMSEDDMEIIANHVRNMINESLYEHLEYAIYLWMEQRNEEEQNGN